MKKALKYGCMIAMTAALCGGCKKAGDPAERTDVRKPLEVVGVITGAATAETKTVTDDFDSYESEAGFSDGDQIGFYSMRDGNGDDTKGLVNFPMTYVAAEKCFKNDALIVDYPNNFGYTFAYYPYQADNTDEIDIYKSDGSIEDLLIAGTSRLSGGRIYLSFVHAFSMLIILPGTGFETAAENEANIVRVVLKYGVRASVVRHAENGVITLELTRDDTAPRSFLAKRRTNTRIMIGGEEIPVCYSVVLPNDVEIDHIEITDNHGMVQQIYPQVEALERGWRYPIKVSMTGTTPTVWPYEIMPWVSDTDPIELGGTYGINTADEFKSWVTVYNRYMSEQIGTDEREALIEQLRPYGEMTEGKWRFQLNANIDCTDLFGTGVLTSLVERLTDEFDGRNHTLSNLNAPLIGTIGEQGRLADLNINGVDITSETDDPVGAVVSEMTGGEVTDCDIENIRIETGGPVGAIAGNATAGSITGNKVNGLLLGTESSEDGITGRRTANVTCENNISSALIF